MAQALSALRPNGCQNARVPVPVIGVHHVSLQVEDLAAARQFYGDVLGLLEIERPDFAVEGAWFQLGTSQLHLGVEDGHLASVRQHFAVLVADLDSAVATIEAHGVSVRKAGLTLPGAGYQAFVRDPSGNLIDLNQPE